MARFRGIAIRSNEPIVSERAQGRLLRQVYLRNPSPQRSRLPLSGACSLNSSRTWYTGLSASTFPSAVTVYRTLATFCIAAMKPDGRRSRL